jgi:hypothetical protein
LCFFVISFLISLTQTYKKREKYVLTRFLWI